jgi:hypothetical protein
MTHDITKQPKWVQELLAEKEKELERTKDKLERTQTAHAVLMKREWFTIRGPLGKNDPDHYSLFILRTNSAHPVCSLDREDLLLVGRATKKVKAA